MKDVKVYAQNLRSYNMGLDQGRWITLGIEEQELQKILTDYLHLTENHPDMAIFDYEADFEISEFEDIYELNQAVTQLKQLPEQDYEKVMDYCDARDITSPLEISNVCLQADEVPYERFPDWIDENVKDPEEKLGYALFKNNLDSQAAFHRSLFQSGNRFPRTSAEKLYPSLSSKRYLSTVLIMYSYCKFSFLFFITPYIIQHFSTVCKTFSCRNCFLSI